MKKPIYIFNDGEIKRQDDTIVLIKEDKKQTIPVNTVSEIHVFGEIVINKRILEFLNANNIPIFFYNYYGYYIGCYYPRDYLNSGIMIIKQTQAYLNKDERLYLAKSFLYGGISNLLKNINYYERTKSSNIRLYADKINEKLKDIDNKQDIPSLMSLEGDIRKIYYDAFNEILNTEGFYLEKRIKKPPDNPINAIISFGNSLMYSVVLSQIYRTHLDPRIGFLHESNQRSFSLNLDIAEVFKPIIVDRVIFSLINKNQIQLKHFEESIDYTYLNENGKKIFIKAFEDKLNTTIKYKDIGNVSYRRLIRIECYKLYKHFLGEEVYKPFISNW